MTPRLPLASVPYALTIADGAVTDAKIVGMAYTKLTGAPASLPPSGTAGGDLTGSYPNPSVGTGKIDNTKLASDATSLLKVSGGAMMSSAGRIVIGTVAPAFPLSFSATLGDKIALWGDQGNNYGIGVQSGLLQLHSDIAASDIAFGYGTSGTFTERMRVKGNGNVGIGTSTPGTKLDVSGIARMTGFQLGTTATAGQVLTSDTTGTGTWQALPTSLPPSGPAGGDLTGTYPNPIIGAGKVSTAAISDSAVTSAKIADGTIAAADIAANAVTNAKVADASITTAKIADANVTDAKIVGWHTPSSPDPPPASRRPARQVGISAGPIPIRRSAPVWLTTPT